ncbi:MAG: PilZ domain-containing protein [Kiritimatiellae bacterium]|nr:PilZ domain-containing protein [Kiritimatiellia bacterium]
MTVPGSSPIREQRRHRRLKFERPAEVLVVRGPDGGTPAGTRLRGMLRDVSAAGLNFACGQTLSVGATVYVDIALPERGRVFKLAGRTIRCDRKADRFEIGIELVDRFRRRTAAWERLVFDALRELNDPV